MNDISDGLELSRVSYADGRTLWRLRMSGMEIILQISGRLEWASVVTRGSYRFVHNATALAPEPSIAWGNESFGDELDVIR